MRSGRATLSGWGRTAATVATLVETEAEELLTPGVLTELTRTDRGIAARGLGRSYGDPAQNGGGTVIRLQPGPNPILLDETAGTIRVDAGVSLDQVMRRIVPRGWFVPVSPGTRFVTVGGAVASDIHGKNHHADRSFGSHVVRLDILLADGSHRSITADSEPDLWWATIGGMGLTGLITSVTFRMLPIETSRCLVHTQRIPHLDALLDAMESGDHDHRYSVAWIDLVAGGSSLGRSVLTRGDHATMADLDDHGSKARTDPLAFNPGHLAAVPPVPNVLNRLAVRAFNEVWYRKAPADHVGLETITGFFHPLDMVGSWNRLYGRHGFLQYQFVVPFDADDTLRAVIERVSASGHASFLAVLKRFGAESGGMLSFPTPGWTLTLDLPAAAPGLGPLLQSLDEHVMLAGGRHYLAKDATATPEVIRAGYPRLDEWKAIRHTVDPTGVWASDQARRLDLLSAPS